MIVVDEVHERHLPCDLLLSILKVVSKRRNAAYAAAAAEQQAAAARAAADGTPYDLEGGGGDGGAARDRTKPLKIVLMSATLNSGLFSSYFDNAPVLQVPGRMFPVKVHYVPTPADKDVARLAAAADAAHMNCAAAEAAAAEAAAALASANDSSSAASSAAASSSATGRFVAGSAMPEELAAKAKATEEAAEAARKATMSADHTKRRVRMPFDPSPYVRLMQVSDEIGHVSLSLSGSLARTPPPFGRLSPPPLSPPPPLPPPLPSPTDLVSAL